MTYTIVQYSGDTLDGFKFVCFVGLQYSYFTNSHLFHKKLIDNSIPNNSPGNPAIDIMMSCMQLEDIANEMSILCKGEK
jgi:hypothetical protein